MKKNTILKFKWFWLIILGLLAILAVAVYGIYFSENSSPQHREEMLGLSYVAPNGFEEVGLSCFNGVIGYLGTGKYKDRESMPEIDIYYYPVASSSNPIRTLTQEAKMSCGGDFSNKPISSESIGGHQFYVVNTTDIEGQDRTSYFLISQHNILQFVATDKSKITFAHAALLKMLSTLQGQ